jgi:hypothetical protein
MRGCRLLKQSTNYITVEEEVIPAPVAALLQQAQLQLLLENRFHSADQSTNNPTSMERGHLQVAHHQLVIHKTQL